MSCTSQRPAVGSGAHAVAATRHLWMHGPETAREFYTRTMAPEVAEVLETVKSMTHAQRADLAYHVLLTLDEGAVEDPAVVESAWREEVGRRVDDYLGGGADLINVEESHARIRDELATDR
jgi:hypothetical protein